MENTSILLAANTRHFDDDDAQCRLDVATEDKDAEAELEPRPGLAVSFTTLVTCRVSVERMMTAEPSRVAMNRPLGLGLQCADAVQMARGN